MTPDYAKKVGGILLGRGLRTGKVDAAVAGVITIITGVRNCFISSLRLEKGA